MKNPFLLLLAFIVPLFVAKAQTAEEPLYVPLKFWGVSYSTSQHGPPSQATFSMSIAGVASTLTGSGSDMTSPLKSASIVVGKNYTVTYSLSGGGPAVGISKVAVRAPRGYRVIFNGADQTSFDPSGLSGASTVRVMPEGAVNAAPVGVATSLVGGRIFWQVSLGSRLNGDPGGVLMLAGSGLDDWNLHLSPSGLVYDSTDGEGAYVYRGTNGAIRQVKAGTCFVNVVDQTAAASPYYELRFYNPASVTDLTSNTYPKGFVGQPFVTYRISGSVNGAWKRLTINKYPRKLNNTNLTTGNEDGVTETTYVERDVWDGAANRFPAWRAASWFRGSEVTVTTHTWTSLPPAKDNTARPNGHRELIETKDVSDLALVGGAAVIEHEDLGWGRTPVYKETAAGKQWLYYWTDPSNNSDAAGKYGYLRATRDDSGAWQALEYVDTTEPAKMGTPRTVYGPWLNDTPAPFTEATPTADPQPTTLDPLAFAGTSTSTTWTTDAFGNLSRPLSQVTKIGGQQHSKLLNTYEEYSYQDRPVIKTITKRYPTAGDDVNYLVSTAHVYKEDYYEPFYRAKPFAVTNADNTAISYGRSKGWIQSDRTYTVDVNGDSARHVAISGMRNASSGGDLCEYFDGLLLDKIYLIAGKSTIDVLVLNSRCLPNWTAKSVWNGSAWEKLEHVDYYYDKNMRIIRKESFGAVIYEAEYSASDLLSEVDASGVKTSYTYDNAGRLKTARREGYGSTPELLTTYYYDGAGRMMREVKSDGALTKGVVTSAEYDTAGRLLKQTASDNIITAYFYDTANRTVATKRGENPDDVTKPVLQRSEVAYKDGRLKSVIGNAGVPEYYAYSVAAGTGYLETTVNSGAETSPRKAVSVSDGLGRVIITRRPRYSGVENHAETHYYNSKGQLIKTSRGSEAGQPLPAGTAFLADTLYEYDAYGRQFRTASDVNGNGVIDLAGPDRISESEEKFVKLSGEWWARKEGFSYLQANVGVATSTGYALNRMTGLTATLRGETKAYDIEGNLSTTTVEVERSLRKVTTRSTAVGLTLSPEEVSVNGFVTSRTGADGLSVQISYDAWGRVQRTSGQRGQYVDRYYTDFSAVTLPGPSPITLPRLSDRIDCEKNNEGVQVSKYVYDHFGRVKQTVNAEGKAAYTEYNDRGQPLRIWGAAAMPVEYEYNGYGERTKMHTFQGGSGWDLATWPAAVGTKNTTTWDFDEASGLLKSKKDALTNAVSYTYDAYGRVKERKWARSVGGVQLATTHVYFDGTGDLKSKDYNDATPDLAFTYTRTGAPATITDGSGTRSFGYDSSKPWRHIDETLADGYRLTSLYEESTTAALSGCVAVPGRSRGYQFGTPIAPASILDQTVGVSGLGRIQVVATIRASVGGLPAASRNFTYGYLAGSSLLQTTASGDFSVTRSYETSRDVMTKLETKWAAGTLTRYSYVSDALGRRRHSFQTGSAFSDYGLINGSEGVRQDYEYDERGQVTRAKASFDTEPSGASYQVENGAFTPAAAGPGARALPDRQNAYAYDQAGNRTGAVFNHSGAAAPPASATYNAANQLTSQAGRPFAVRGTAPTAAVIAVEDIEDVSTPATAPANRVSGSNYWHKELSFILTAEEWRRSGRTFFVGAYQNGSASQESRFAFFSGRPEPITYDLDGNLEKDERWSYKWDAENRLIEQTSRDWMSLAGAGPQKRLSYGYDYMGRRVWKRVHTLDQSGYVVSQEETRFFYAGWNLIAEATVGEDGSLVFKRSYYWGLDVAGSLTASGGVGSLLQIADHADGKTYFPAYDGNGNVTALVNGADGTAAASYEYSPFGESLRAPTTGIGAANPFRFSTKYTDAETGLVYYGMRYYDPEKGRFINRDPIEERGGLNLYGFCGNDGVNRYDVLGMSWFSKLFKKVKKWFKKNWTSIVGAALFFVPGVGPLLSAAWNAGVGYYYGGVKGMAIGFASSYIGGRIAGGLGIPSKLATNMLAGGIAGGVSAGVSGGNIGEGFLSGATTAGVITAAGPLLQYGAQGLSAGAMKVGSAIRSVGIGIRHTALNVLYPNVPEGTVTLGELQVPDWDESAGRWRRDPAVPSAGGGFEASPSQLAQAMEAMSRAPGVQQPWGGQGYSALRAIGNSMSDSGMGSSLRYGSKFFGAATMAGVALPAAALAAGPAVITAGGAVVDGYAAMGVYTASASTNLAYVGTAGTAAGGIVQLQGRFDFGQAIQATGMLANRLAAPIAQMQAQAYPYAIRATEFINAFMSQDLLAPAPTRAAQLGWAASAAPDAIDGYVGAYDAIRGR